MEGNGITQRNGGTEIQETLPEFGNDQPVIVQYNLVDAAQWNTTGQAVRGNQAIEWIARPTDFQRLQDKSDVRHFVNDESGVG